MNILDKKFELEVYENKKKDFEEKKQKSLCEIKNIKANYNNNVEKIKKDLNDFTIKLEREKKKSLILMIIFPIFIKRLKNNIKNKEMILKELENNNCAFNLYKLKKERDELLQTKYNDIKIWEHYIESCNKIIDKIKKEIEELYYKENQKYIENSNGKIVSFKKRSR